jgi:hypothetical protein
VSTDDAKRHRVPCIFHLTEGIELCFSVVVTPVDNAYRVVLFDDPPLYVIRSADGTYTHLESVPWEYRGMVVEQIEEMENRGVSNEQTGNHLRNHLRGNRQAM